MKYTESFKDIMRKQEAIALATSVNDVPNVRIVNFIYEEGRKKLYFTTFINNRKIEEFNMNDTIAFTTIPQGNTMHVKVKEAKVKKSDLSIEEVQEAFATKIENMKEMFTVAKDQLLLYEVTFKDATVAIDYTQIETISI